MVNVDNKFCMGTVYTPAEFEESILRMQRSGHNYYRKFVDYELLDAFGTLLTRNPGLSSKHGRTLFEQLRTAVKDERVTKMFKNVENTNSSFHHFLGVDKPNFTWNINFKAASALLEKTLITKLDPVIFHSSEELLESFSNKNASSGHIGRGSKADNIEEVYSRYVNLRETVSNGGDPDTIALSFHRSQISGYMKDGKLSLDTIKYKDRLVWGIDAATVALESQFAIPFIDHMMKNCEWYAGGKSSDDISAKIRKHRHVHRWYSLDFSQFDQTVPAWLIKHAFYLIGKCFGPEWNTQLKWICNNFINTKLVLMGGRVVEKHRGIPSGSNFTQAVGSICNALVILTYLISRSMVGSIRNVTAVLEGMGGAKPDELAMIVMGDDNLFFWSKSLDLDDLSSYVVQNFGMYIHPDKTDFGWTIGADRTAPKFLKREWRWSGAYRNPLEIMVNSVHPERDRRRPEYNPYALVYGLFLTYPGAFVNYFSEQDILECMAELKILGNLQHLEARDLPGSIRALGDKGVEYIRRRAKAFLGDARRNG